MHSLYVGRLAEQFEGLPELISESSGIMAVKVYEKPLRSEPFSSSSLVFIHALTFNRTFSAREALPPQILWNTFVPFLMPDQYFAVKKISITGDRQLHWHRNHFLLRQVFFILIMTTFFDCPYNQGRSSRLCDIFSDISEDQIISLFLILSPLDWSKAPVYTHWLLGIGIGTQSWSTTWQDWWQCRSLSTTTRVVSGTHSTHAQDIWWTKSVENCKYWDKDCPKNTFLTWNIWKTHYSLMSWKKRRTAKTRRLGTRPYFGD